MTLAEGEYVLIARHEGKVYTREFKVESGLDRDVEIVIATDPEPLPEPFRHVRSPTALTDARQMIGSRRA